MSIKNLIKKVIYGHKSSGDTYIDFCRRGGASIGKNVTVYNALNTVIDETSLPFISIGENVQITAGVTILAHDYSYSVLGNVYKELPRQQRLTIIGNNVFIGMNSTILMGAEIGDNVIIGAGSVVAGKVPSNMVFAGNPARAICTLEEFYNKSCDRFESSALCYYHGTKKTKNLNSGKDMIIYQALFANPDELKEIIMKSNFCGLESKMDIDMSRYRKYKDFKSFLEGNK